MKGIKYLKENGVDVDTSLDLFGDLEIYNATMKDFLDGIDLKLRRLEKYKELNDLPNYAIFAHSVKSDARYLGFKLVAEEALKHEMAGKENNQHLIISSYDSFIQSIKEMSDVVRKYLTEEPDDIIRVVHGSKDKKTVLIADDSPLILNLVKKALQSKYNIVEAYDGKQVIERINEFVDIILLDLNMPVKNGFEVLEYLKEKSLFDRINVSIITGDESKETIQQAFTYPIVDMLNKPFSINDLLRVVEKTIEKKSIN